MHSSHPEKWVYDNAGQEFKYNIPWKDIKPYVKSLRVFFDQDNEDFSTKKVKKWLQEHVRDAPKLTKIEMCIRYREGFVETKKVDRYGADIDWQYGRKDRTMRFAADLWSFRQLKRVSFTVQKNFDSGGNYPWYSTERDQDKKVWKDWTSARWAW